MKKEKMKICTKCKQKKFANKFSFDKRHQDGLTSSCKRCHRLVDKVYRQSEKGKLVKKCYQQSLRGKEISKRTLQNYRKTLIGYLRHRFYNIKQRCNNSNFKQYKDYGGRGIKCLFKSADEFIDYVLNDLKIKNVKLDIDRIDNNGHYERGNIRFVTHLENCNNR